MRHILSALCVGLLLCVSGQAEAKLKWNEFSLEGFVDAGFSVSLFPPQATEAASWTINEIELGLEYQAEYVGARVALHYLAQNLTPSSANALLLDTFVQEGWVQLKAPLAQGWGFYARVGKYFSPFGWDAINTVDRYQITASYANEITPNTFTGLKVGFKNDVVDLAFYLSNGWDLITDVDLHPTVAISANIKIGVFELVGAIVNGREPSAVKPAKQDGRLTMIDTQMTVRLVNNTLILGTEVNFTVHPDGDFWYILLLCAHYMPIKWIGGTIRYGRFSDPQNLKGAQFTDNDEVSIAILSRPLPGFTAMFEYRIDIEGNAATTRLQRHFIGIKAIYQF